MFNFFKKKNQPTNYGTFSAYGMEEIYHFLSENRIKEKIRELKNTPTLGTSFEDFVSDERVKYPSGELHFFIMLLWYFPNELDLALYLSKKSKEFSESDYPKKLSLKMVWKDHLNSMNNMIERYPEKKDYWNLEKRPVFWLEYDMLYVELLKNFVFNFNLQKFSKIKIEGEFKKNGSKILSHEIEILFRSKRKPKVGYYLTFKSDLLFMDIKIDLTEIHQNIFKFQTLFNSYQLEIFKDSAKISKVSSFSNDKINLIYSTDFKEILQDITSKYIVNFDKISDRYTNEIRKTEINFFFFIALRIKELESNILSKIEFEINSKKEIWLDKEKYFQWSIQGIDLKTIK